MMYWLESLTEYKVGQAVARRMHASDEVRRRALLGPHRFGHPRTVTSAHPFAREIGDVAEQAAREPTRTTILVAVGGSLLVLTWVMVVVLVATSESNAAFVAGIANVASVLATLMLIRGVHERRRERQR